MDTTNLTFEQVSTIRNLGVMDGILSLMGELKPVERCGIEYNEFKQMQAIALSIWNKLQSAMPEFD